MKNLNLFFSRRPPITAGTITQNKNLSFSPFTTAPTSIRTDVCRHKASRTLHAIRENPSLGGFELIPSSSRATNEAAWRAIDNARFSFIHISYTSLKTVR